jgi:alkanesulfonate monooxygenase SsuD/methylene tetrahydromethanopterin reductase-like flavin-dependent oxidoreductase (luciferase family)
MADYGQELRFGVFITPTADRADGVVELARLADLVGLDLVSFQDHPYQARFLDTWTLLAVVAAETTNVRVAPNVANLPLRQPFVLARSVATLDLLSGGRVELGLGAGAFWDAIAALGGPRLTPGQGVDALAEAIAVIRAAWDTSERSIRLDGEHYRIQGAHPGPAPAHDVEIWLGAYKPRMLRLTGTEADGWVPSMGYADPPDLPEMSAAVDEAARAAGRHPAEIRRLYNVNGEFGTGAGFLEGGPAQWAEQLAELTLTTGMSSYVLAVASESDLRRFAEEVAPAVRELVEAARSSGHDEPAPPAVAGTGPAAPRAKPFSVEPTGDDGTRLSDEQPWGEDDRPSGPDRDGERRYTADEQAAGQHLIDVHDALRTELRQLRDLLDQVGDGDGDPARLRSLFNRMTIRQNNWTLGAFCQSYCRAVSGHHTLEDSGVFPHLARADDRLGAVLDRLGEEHEVIAEILDRIDAALVALVAAEPDGLERVRGAVDLLTDAMLSHLSYEERELVEPLARLGYR